MPSAAARPRFSEDARPESPLRRRMSREEQKALRARAILDAAWALFCEKGYEAISIEEVGERAGYSRQPVYTLFGDKQSLFFELQRHATVDVMDLLFGGLRPGAPLREVLSVVADAAAEQLNQNKPQYGQRLFIVAQLISMSRPDIAAKLQEQARWVIDEIARIIRRAPLADGEDLRDQPEAIATHLAAHINGLTTVQFQTGNKLTQAHTLRGIFHALAFAPVPGRDAAVAVQAPA